MNRYGIGNDCAIRCSTWPLWDRISGWLGAKLKMGVARRGSAVDAQAKQMAARADAVVVAAGFGPETESEGADRTFGLPPGQDELISEMAAANKNTIVVVTSGGGVDMSGWVERVPALIEAWYPGQEGGTALAEILAGDVNPSGRLPVTFERRWEDNPVHASYYPADVTKRVEYREGVFVGYRGYEHNNTKPLFPFGYGLSYTTFQYGNLTVNARVFPFAHEPTLTFASPAVYDRTGDKLTFQFAHLLPAVLAEAHGIGGDSLMFAMSGLLSGVALLAFFVVAWRFIGNPYGALGAVVAFAFLLPQVVFSRDMYSELPTQVLLFTALWTWLANRQLEPSTPLKFALGLLQLGLGFGALWYGAQSADGRGMVARRQDRPAGSAARSAANRLEISIENT